MEKTNFGISQVTKRTPAWASWTFRITFVLTTVAAFIIAGDPAISDENKIRIGLYLKGADMLIYSLSKMFGVEVKKDETSN